MTDIRQAKIGDALRWAWMGRWTYGFIHDIFPGGYVVDHHGKYVELTVEKLIKCQAVVTPRGLCE
jgi:hypothetical protein